MPHALIVDDDPESSAAMREIAVAEGYSCDIASSLTQSRLHIALRKPILVLCELCLPDGSGLELFRSIDPVENIKIVLLTAQPSIESAIRALQSGANDYLIKPISHRRLSNLFARLADKSVNSAEPELLTIENKPDKKSHQFGKILGSAPVMQTLYHHIRRVAPTEATVFLLGESGTGKELVAQTIHAQSLRHKFPFFPVNCGAISPQLIESEIFGHEKGSFTGADRQHKGYFERASGGTLFLDEVIEMPIELQVKLLRVLETGSFMRIGSNQELLTDVRIIAASNRDPEAAIAEGKLRLDLYHRLNVFPLKIPALRERGQDIELLAQHFLDEFNAAHASQKSLSPKARTVLSGYHWPGNVRELRNFMQRAYILSDQVIEASMLEPSVNQRVVSALTLAIPVGTSLADVDRKLIFATLDLCGGVKKRAADVLGISLKTLYNRIEEYGAHDKLRVCSDKLPGSTVAKPLSMPGYDSSLLN
jgi:DNA-binding NtrC family response regulator